MGDHYILERYLSNSLEDEEYRDEFQVEQTNIYTEKVPQWTTGEVGDWLRRIGFSEFCDIFHQVGVDGDILLTLTDTCMKDDLEMKNGIMRKRFQRELRTLKRNTDYSCLRNGEEIAQWLSSISVDFREFTYNLQSKDMTLEYMEKLSKEDLMDMLKDAGVENSVHQLKIYEAMLQSHPHHNSYDLPSDESSISSEPHGASALSNYDVYITYPVEGGAELASLIKMQLELRGYSAFLATNNHQGLPQRNKKIIQETKHFVLVLVPGSLDSCKVSSNKSSDKIREEIHAALQHDSVIIPVVDNFQWPASEELDPEVREVAYFNNVRWVHEYQDACIQKLERFLGGESYVTIDTPWNNNIGKPLARSRRSSGISTPMSGWSMPSRRVSEAPLSNSLSALLSVPRHLRRSNASLISTDSGMDTLNC